ncbi:hypothetical protein TWF128_009089 [Orbilia oligospora]|nr:hypothetical protein TWF128_009089 [Orbilia oligospora]
MSQRIKSFEAPEFATRYARDISHVKNNSETVAQGHGGSRPGQFNWFVGISHCPPCLSGHSESSDCFTDGLNLAAPAKLIVAKPSKSFIYSARAWY